jgi:hypothetical protein
MFYEKNPKPKFFILFYSLKTDNYSIKRSSLEKELDKLLKFFLRMTHEINVTKLFCSCNSLERLSQAKFF